MAAPVSYVPVATRDEATRSDFIIKVYQHLVLAVLAFATIEAVFLRFGLAEAAYNLVAGSGMAWLLVLGGFMLVSWLASTAAHDVLNPSRQYGGLFALAVAEALIFAPFLHYLFRVESSGSGTVWAAAVITAAGFAGLSAVAYTTRKDLSFLRPMLMWGGVCALVLIAAALLFGFDLGVWFSLAMIALAGGSILYETQRVMRSYPPEAYVGAAVQLFASVMLLFWYVLRLLSQMRR
jgi:FtsH-binding integral membrane protein